MNHKHKWQVAPEMIHAVYELKKNTGGIKSVSVKSNAYLCLCGARGVKSPFTGLMVELTGVKE